MHNPDYIPIPLERSLVPVSKPRTRQNGTAIKKAVFLEIFALFWCNISMTCRHTKIGRNTVYTWKQTDPVFAQAMADTWEEVIEKAETQLVAEAMKYKPNIVALIFFLKNNHAKYADKLALSGQVDSNINFTGYEQLTDEQLARAIQEIEAGVVKTLPIHPR